MKQMRANKANPQPSHAERGEVAFPASGRPTLKPPGNSPAATVVFSTSQAAAVRFQPVPRIFDDSLDSWHDGERPCVPIPLFDSRCMSVSTAATLTATTNEAAIHASRLHGDFPCRWDSTSTLAHPKSVYPGAGVQRKRSKGDFGFRDDIIVTRSAEPAQNNHGVSEGQRAQGQRVEGRG